jgi:hypothetical protein
LAATLSREVLKHSGDQAAIVAYVNWDSSSEIVIDQFLKYALLHKVRSPSAEELRHGHFSQEVNRIIGEIRSGVDKFAQVIGCLKFELTNKRNKTPFLLPIKNFDSDVLVDSLHRVSSDLISVGDSEAGARFLSRVTQDFFAHHPQAQMSDGKMAHQNGSSLIFRPPGNNLHGAFEDAEEHVVECRLGARLRVGHSYPEGFHYDANYPGQTRTMGGLWPSCHAQHAAKEGLRYLNISPNDFIRDGRSLLSGQ